MEFTKENWENAPEGARLEHCLSSSETSCEVYLIGYKRSGYPVIEFQDGRIGSVYVGNLRIALPKRKVTVQLWQCSETGSLHSTVDAECILGSWNELGEHTFEIEGE